MLHLQAFGHFLRGVSTIKIFRNGRKCCENVIKCRHHGDYIFNLLPMSINLRSHLLEIRVFDKSRHINHIFRN